MSTGSSRRHWCGRGATSRRLDRRKIVSDCLEFAKSSGSWQVSMSELCHAANACESSVRQAFVEVFDMPPTQYFQFRLLSSLRAELLRADPREETVTRIAGSLGVTHLGRTSGRYRAVFGEVPSETLLATARRGDRAAPPSDTSNGGDSG